MTWRALLPLPLTPRVADSVELGGAQEFAFPSSSCVMLVLLLWGPRSENHQLRGKTYQ